jgi:isoquinoline 1-oxidoreductase beta subunit
MKACQTVAERAVGKFLTTVEGVSGPVIDAVRDVWHRGNVVQCGYCQPGQMPAAAALPESDSSPSDAKIDEWMSGNLCRCGTYPRIRAAIHAAAGTLDAGRVPAPLTAFGEPEVARLTADEMADPVHPYIRIRQNETIVVFCSQLEMGQGAHTGLATLVAEELDADFDAIRVVNAAKRHGTERRRVREPGNRWSVPAHGGFQFDEGLLDPLPAGGGAGASAPGRCRRRDLADPGGRSRGHPRRAA